MFSLGRRRRRKDAAAAALLEHVRRRTAATPGALLIHVQYAYQRARSGTKALIVHDLTGRVQDAWFPGWRVGAAESFVVEASSGYGPHNHNPDCLYVDRIHEVLPPGTADRAWRHGRETGTPTGGARVSPA